MAPKVLIWLLLEQGESVLLVRRKPDAPPFAGQWLLPGDVMPDHESAEETLRRFAREELDITVTGEEFGDTLEPKDGDDPYVATVFRVTAYNGRPRVRAKGPDEEGAWTTSATLGGLAMPVGLMDLITKTDRKRLADA